MPSKHVLQILLLTADPDLAELYRHECPEGVVTIAKDAASALRKNPKRRFDAVIVESRKDWMGQVQALCEANGQAPPVGLVGATPFLRRARATGQGVTNGGAST